MPALNPLTFDGTSFSWSGRELTQYEKDGKTISFQYDENGLRHRKTVKENGQIIERYDYVWSDGSLITQTYTTYSNGVLDSTNSAKFIYDAWGTLQGFVLNDTATYLYTKNLQGDILSIVNESGQTIVTYEYDSWGAVSFSATSMQNMMLAYTLSFVSPFTYRGYCYDYDIELYYLQSRYYSPEIGRFINTDDTQIAIATQGEVLGANLFAYCNNNPVMNVDYTGYNSKYFASQFYMYAMYNLLSASLDKIMLGITVSVKAIKKALLLAGVAALCVAAILLAATAIIYVVKTVKSIVDEAEHVIRQVKSKVKARGINPNKLRDNTVYVIIENGTSNVIYVGITKNYKARKAAHKKKYPPKNYTMMPIATGLTRKEARAMEQTIITAYTLKYLNNSINSISKKRWGNFQVEFNRVASLMQSWVDPE